MTSEQLKQSTCVHLTSRAYSRMSRWRKPSEPVSMTCITPTLSHCRSLMSPLWYSSRKYLTEHGVQLWRYNLHWQTDGVALGMSCFGEQFCRTPWSQAEAGRWRFDHVLSMDDMSTIPFHLAPARNACMQRPLDESGWTTDAQHCSLLVKGRKAVYYFYYFSGRNNFIDNATVYY